MCKELTILNFIMICICLYSSFQKDIFMLYHVQFSGKLWLLKSSTYILYWRCSVTHIWTKRLMDNCYGQCASFSSWITSRLIDKCIPCNLAETLQIYDIFLVDNGLFTKVLVALLERTYSNLGIWARFEISPFALRNLRGMRTNRNMFFHLSLNYSM